MNAKELDKLAEKVEKIDRNMATKQQRAVSRRLESAAQLLRAAAYWQRQIEEQALRAAYGRKAEDGGVS